MWYIMWVPSIAGIVLGILSLKQNKDNYNANRNDKIMSIIGIILAGVALLIIIMIAVAVIFFRESINEILENYNYNSY
jgi:membrane protease YdiL (CAAX protease family)